MGDTPQLYDRVAKKYQNEDIVKQPGNLPTFFP